MIRDKDQSKLNESSSMSKSIFGRQEGIGSVPFTRGPNFEEGSSSSYNHNNYLREQQRLMMLQHHRTIQGMPPHPVVNQYVNHQGHLLACASGAVEHDPEQSLRIVQAMPPPPAVNQYVNDQDRLLARASGAVEHGPEQSLGIVQAMPLPQHTDPRSSNTVHDPVYLPGSRFLPTDLGLVRIHLRNKVEFNKSGFITTLDLYKDEPWLLDHVHNDLFKRGEWYYFTPRNKRGVKAINRTVPGSRGSKSGAWKSTSKKEPIKDKDKKVQGYTQSLVYNKISADGKLKPTGWNMTEFCLHEKNQDDLVLCRIKGSVEKKEFVEEVKDNILSPNQVQDHEEYATQQQQQQLEQDALALVIPPHDGQDLGFETMMRTHNNDNHFVHMLEEDHGDATQQQQQQQYAPVQYIQPHQEGQDLGFETTMAMQTNNNNFMMMPRINHGDATQHQQVQDAPAQVLPPHQEGQDPWFERIMTLQNNENNFMRMWGEDQLYELDDWDLYFDVDEFLKDDANQVQLQQPVSQAHV